MGYGTRILLDSISPAGRRITTWELTYPRMVHAELMTHRLFSRNSASSRAIPNEKLRARVKDDPALPVWWGKNQSGMQAREELSTEKRREHAVQFAGGRVDWSDESERDEAKRLWLDARDMMLDYSERLAKVGLHKQLCNRLIEPWMFITVIVTSTSFDNWFHQRNHKDAQPEIAWVARDMWEKIQASKPRQLAVGAWHLPLLDVPLDASEEDKARADEDAQRIADLAMDLGKPRIQLAKEVSTGRVARVSYLTHDGRRDIREDIALHDRLLAGQTTGDPLHMSPFEHPAKALYNPNEQSGNFRGWGQYRKEIPNEHFGEAMP